MINEKAIRFDSKRSLKTLSEDQRLDLLAEYLLDRIIAKIANDKADTLLKNIQGKEMLKA